jgi:hypothetical protein
MKFSMQTERDAHLPLLNIDIYRKPDRSLDHRVYRKPTHTNVYLHAKSHRHPSNKQAVLSTLVHTARALCDHERLHDELKFLRDTFKRNGYGDRQIRRTLDSPKSRYHPGEAHFGCPSSLCQHDFQSHQPYAVQAHQVCGPPAEENYVSFGQ